MDVSTANNICSTISILRTDVYNNKNFMSTFEDNLKNNIDANNVSYSPNKKEGIQVNVDMNTKCNDSASFISNIKKSLEEAIFIANPSVLQRINCENLYNACMVSVIGPSSLIIEL
jgi:hypothetical protein